MDREALVLRNRSMAEAFHRPPLRHRIRHLLLQAVAGLPIRSVRPHDTNRILLIRPDHLGDVLLTTPAIHALRAAIPQAEIHALVGPWSARLLSHYPEIDLVLTLPFPGFSRDSDTSLHSPYRQVIQSARNLRRVGYTSAIILRPDHWWGALLAFLAGIPHRIGYELPDVTPFLTDRISHQHDHAIAQSLRLVEYWTGKSRPEKGVYRFPIDTTEQHTIDDYLQTQGIAPNAKLICIHPGSGSWVKLWQTAYWAIVADTLSEQLDALVVLTGGTHEVPMVREIATKMEQPVVITAGETGIEQLARLYSRAKVVLGPDSGPLHLAAAVGAPTVALFGPADPAEFAPWGPREKHIVLSTDIGCRPCRILDWADDAHEFHPCVHEIKVGEVLSAARRAANYTP